MKAPLPSFFSVPPLYDRINHTVSQILLMRALWPSAPLFAAVLLLVALAAGCIDEADDPTRLFPEATSSAPLVGATPVLSDTLTRFAPPAPDGWRFLAPPAGMTLDEDDSPLVTVTASYVPVTAPNGTATGDVDLVIQDNGGQPIGFAKLLGLLEGAPQSAGVVTRTTIRGHRAYEIRDDRSISLYLVVADRFIVYLAVTDATPADYDAFVAALDLDGLARLR